MSDLERVKQNGEALQHVKEQTLEICLEAVKQNGYALEHVKNQTPEICLAAVKESGYALQYVKEQTHEICLAAIQQKGYALQFMEEQTPELCLAAVKQDGATLKYVKEQTPELCLAAIRQSIYAFKYVNIIFDISPVISLFDGNLTMCLIDNNFIKNMFLFKIDKPNIIKKYLKSRKNDIELVKILQEYSYPFSKEQILKSIQHKVEIPNVHQYGYDLNTQEFKQVFKYHKFYPESYNLDI